MAKRLKGWRRARALVRRRFAGAHAVRWWSGERTWIISPYWAAFQAFDLGGARNVRTAWRRAARRPHSDR